MLSPHLPYVKVTTLLYDTCSRLEHLHVLPLVIKFGLLIFFSLTILEITIPVRIDLTASHKIPEFTSARSQSCTVNIPIDLSLMYYRKSYFQVITFVRMIILFSNVMKRVEPKQHTVYLDLTPEPGS